jgi:hypothetical protein
MKVGSTGPVRPAGAVTARRNSGQGGSGFSVASASSAKTAAMSGTTPLASVSALLAVQGAQDPTDGRSRGRARGNALLDRLDEIRLGLLADGIPRHTLRALAVELRQCRSECSDPELNDVLDAIELRAMVELAKYDDGVSP